MSDLRLQLTTVLGAVAALVLGILGVTDDGIRTSVQAVIAGAVGLVLAVATWQSHRTHRAGTTAAVQAAAIRKDTTTADTLAPLAALASTVNGLVPVVAPLLPGLLAQATAAPGTKIDPAALLANLTAPPNFTEPAMPAPASGMAAANGDAR